jgi:hypothetical protein
LSVWMAVPCLDRFCHNGFHLYLAFLLPASYTFAFIHVLPSTQNRPRRRRLHDTSFACGGRNACQEAPGTTRTAAVRELSLLSTEVQS